MRVIARLCSKDTVSVPILIAYKYTHHAFTPTNHRCEGINYSAVHDHNIDPFSHFSVVEETFGEHEADKRAFFNIESTR